MTDDQMAARFDRIFGELSALRGEMDRRFDGVDRRFERIEDRLGHLGKTAVTRSDLFQSVIVAQGVFYAGALAMVVVLNAVGAFG